MGFKLTNKNILHSLHGNVKPSALRFDDPDKENEWTYVDGDEETANIRTRSNWTPTGTTDESAWINDEDLQKKYKDQGKGFEDFTEEAQAWRDAQVETQNRKDTREETIDFDPGSFNWDKFSKVINDREGKNYTGESIRKYYDKVGYEKFNTYIKNTYPFMMTGPKRRKIVVEGKTDFKDIG
jgi:hypothetical protein